MLQCVEIVFSGAERQNTNDLSQKQFQVMKVFKSSYLLINYPTFSSFGHARSWSTAGKCIRAR